jgi:hypothetical protein
VRIYALLSGPVTVSVSPLFPEEMFAVAKVGAWRAGRAFTPLETMLKVPAPRGITDTFFDAFAPMLAKLPRALRIALACAVGSVVNATAA